MTCQFVSRMPEMRRNLIKLYRRATTADIDAGIAWYPTAHRIVLEWAETYQRPIANVACVIAAISPQCSWERNLVIADDILAGRGPSIGGALNANVIKARHIRDDRATDITRYFPHGPKVASFAVNLAGNWQYPTIDTHAMQAALADVQATYALRWTPYGIFAQCYIDGAHKVGHEPATFQAIIWHTWKRLYPWGRKQKLRQQWYVAGELED